jgi:hypothetical protein
MSSNSGEKIILSAADIKELTGWGINQVYELMHSRYFPSFKRGRKFFVLKTEWQKWLERQRA